MRFDWRVRLLFPRGRTRKQKLVSDLNELRFNEFLTFESAWSDKLTCWTSVGSAALSNWAKMSLIFGVFSFVFLQKVGSSLIARRRIYNGKSVSRKLSKSNLIQITRTSSSSQRSSWRSKAVSINSGKLVKNLAMNVAASFFSFSDPLTASKISLYSRWCWNRNFHLRLDPWVELS